ncbi:MAG: hypothetical protein GF333_01045 [Candidatus Omnitrophica bacterium]|nr:hypothetical protein [Candidatus Omnitrophota bacterium]
MAYGDEYTFPGSDHSCGPLFPKDEEELYKCDFCGRIVEGHEYVEWVDPKRQMFRCPDCGEVLEIRMIWRTS